MSQGVSQNELQNNVPAKNQLAKLSPVRFVRSGGERKVLFIGNSITRHGYRPQIGWYGDWGMAASCAEKDYVHRFMAMFEEEYGKADYCIAQLSEWERTYPEGTPMLAAQYGEARDFEADLVIVRIGENMPKDSAPGCKAYFETMIDFFAAKEAKIVVTDSFWRNDARDAMLAELATERGYAFCRLSDLEDDPLTMAIGLYEHKGVSLHPGDRGMEEIAKRLFAAVQKIM